MRAKAILSFFECVSPLGFLFSSRSSPRSDSTGCRGPGQPSAAPLPPPHRAGADPPARGVARPAPCPPPIESRPAARRLAARGRHRPLPLSHDRWRAVRRARSPRPFAAAWRRAAPPASSSSCCSASPVSGAVAGLGAAGRPRGGEGGEGERERGREVTQRGVAPLNGRGSRADEALAGPAPPQPGGGSPGLSGEGERGSRPGRDPVAWCRR